MSLQVVSVSMGSVLNLPLACSTDFPHADLACARRHTFTRCRQRRPHKPKKKKKESVFSHFKPTPLTLTATATSAPHTHHPRCHYRTASAQRRSPTTRNYSHHRWESNASRPSSTCHNDDAATTG
ncbi:hypothetical protein EDB86DRAFT_2871895 [Lactarius hatsudake]|nr:hypothetical protein EDB86DRAFT_2871895 [Lactarius hatsudake]